MIRFVLIPISVVSKRVYMQNLFSSLVPYLYQVIEIFYGIEQSILIQNDQFKDKYLFSEDKTVEKHTKWR